MENPSKFWLQIVGPKATELDCLVDEMTGYYSKPENKSQHTLDDVNPGDLVAAVFQYDNKWLVKNNFINKLFIFVFYF